MFREERLNYILAILEKYGKVLVEDLSTQFEICKSMIRKDLKILEEKKLLQRTYGGAINIENIIIKGENFFERVEEHTTLKEIIAEKVYKEINEYDTIFFRFHKYFIYYCNITFKK